MFATQQEAGGRGDHGTVQQSLCLNLLSLKPVLLYHVMYIGGILVQCTYLQRITRPGAKGITVQNNNFDLKNSYPSSRCSCNILCILEVS